MRTWCEFILPFVRVSAAVIGTAAGLATLESRNSPEVVCQKIDPPVEVKDFGVDSDSSKDPGSNRSLKCEGSIISWPSDEAE